MKNLFFTIFLLSSITTAAQLTFDKTILDCEDKWVAFPEDNGLHKYGFIYVDSQAGLTFDYSGNLKIDAAGKIKVYANEKDSSIKILLNPTKIKVALIPEANFEQLKISKVPDWLSYYKMKEGSIEHLYMWGSIYTAWGACEKGLVSLEKASKINSDYKEVKVQLAHTYNCLNQYEKAIKLLQKVLIVNPSDAYINKEYIFALVNTQQLDLAIVSYKKALKVCPDTTYVAENAYYILQGYFFKNDRKNFDRWLANTEVEMVSNVQIKERVGMMKIEIKKNK